MRRGLWAAVAAAAVLALGGCGTARIAGDADLSGDWAVLPKAEVPTPVAGVCRPKVGSDKVVDWALASFFLEPPIECTKQHVTETYYVGKLPASEENKPAAPDPGDAAFKTAYTTCAKQATSYLGGDYHNARVSIVAVLPVDEQWQGGARWYRCELIEISDTKETIVARSSSARNGLRGSKPLAVACANDTLTSDKKYVTNIVFVACSKPHYMEYTGVWTPSDGRYPGNSAQSTDKSDNCFRLGATYLGMSVSQLHTVGGISWDSWGGSELMWSVGDRGVRCFMGPYERKQRTGSIKGKSPTSF
jgi:hypothetical protein